MNDTRGNPEITPIETYKQILLSVIENRPSGTRQRLAEALGKNRSFVSQIVNASYPTPIPAQHLETIFTICHFAPAEREAFLAAYREAHPGKLESMRSPRLTRRIVVELPDLGNPALNRKVDEILHNLARSIGGLAASSNESDPDNRESEG
jgi:nitroreductase